MRSLTAFHVFVGSLMILFCGGARATQVIPFEFRDGLIWVKISAAASDEPLNFLLDSGAGESVLSLQTARRLGVKLGSHVSVQLVESGASARRVSGFLANIAGVPICENPLALDLSGTSELCSRPIDGLLGHDFFRGRIVQIDFKAGCIRLLDQADDRKCCAVVPMDLRHGAMCVPASMNGSSPKRTRLDTGCDDGLHWVGGADGRYVRASLQLGDERIANVRTALHKSPIFPSEAGLLGNGVLSNYRVTIDAVNGQLLLERS